MFLSTLTTLQAQWCLLWVFNSAPLFSLYSSHTYRRVCVCMCAVSLHSALNEPIIGVYVALMSVSVRRETLHHSPPNQWGLACYTTPRFSPLTRPLSHHSFLLGPLHFLSISLWYSSSPPCSFSVQLARDKREVSGQLAMKRALNRARWGHHWSCYAQASIVLQFRQCCNPKLCF